MDKILVEVYLPAANKSYDVFISPKSKIYEITEMLSGTFTDLSAVYFKASDINVLCDRAGGTALNINMSAEELGLNNGSKLMLI